jgi:hypothetical protein
MSREPAILRRSSAMQLAYHALFTALDDRRFGVEIVLLVSAASHARAEQLARRFVASEYVGQPIERLDGEEGSVAEFYEFRKFAELEDGALDIHGEGCIEVSRIRLEFDDEEAVDRLFEGNVMKVVFDA